MDHYYVMKTLGFKDITPSWYSNQQLFVPEDNDILKMGMIDIMGDWSDEIFLGAIANYFINEGKKRRSEEILNLLQNK